MSTPFVYRPSMHVMSILRRISTKGDVDSTCINDLVKHTQEKEIQVEKLTYSYVYEFLKKRGYDISSTWAVRNTIRGPITQLNQEQQSEIYNTALQLEKVGEKVTLAGVLNNINKKYANDLLCDLTFEGYYINN